MRLRGCSSGAVREWRLGCSLDALTCVPSTSTSKNYPNRVSRRPDHYFAVRRWGRFQQLLSESSFVSQQCSLVPLILSMLPVLKYKAIIRYV
jgi:hypothetical protein